MKYRIKIVENKTTGITTYVPQAKWFLFWRNISKDIFQTLSLTICYPRHCKSEIEAKHFINKYKEGITEEEIKITYKPIQ